ncbi:hypothetical protein L6R53_29685 [Myxococcota bacterium]|nr:hypothetical protein [Myxococcota bacterium]
MMTTSHDASDPSDRAVAAVLEDVARARRARLRRRLWLVRRCQAHEAPKAVLSLEEVGREKRRRMLEGARKLATLTKRVEGTLPSWVVGQGVSAWGDRGLIRPTEPLPPLSHSGMSTVFPGGQGGLGLNGMKLYEYEDTDLATLKFGEAASQWEDPRDLRVKVLRQFGKRDLLWDFLTAWQDPNQRVPVPWEEAEIRQLVLHGTTGRSDQSNIIRFAELMADAWQTGTRLRFTFLTLGLGSSRLVTEPDGTGAVEGVDEVLLDAIRDVDHPSWVTQRLVMRQYWTEEYSTLADRVEPLRGGTLDRWIRSSLDLQDARKLRAIHVIAYYCAELLVEAAEYARTHLNARKLTLFGVIDGIEVFNEVDGRNVTADAAYPVGPPSAGHWDPVASGQAWGSAWVNAAHGFLRGFSDLRALGRWSPPTDRWYPTLYLPAVSSYASVDVESAEYTDALTQDFWYKHDFLDALVSRVAEVWSFLSGLFEWPAGDIPLGTTDVTLPDLSEVVGGVDYHWYHGEKHKKEGGPDGLGPLSGLWLAMEVRALSDLLLSHGLDGSVTVFETGVGADDAAETYVPETEGVGPLDGGLGPLEQNQANEVFRRILMAAVGGADQMGWHTWMSQGGAFSGYGLRVNSGPDDDPAGNSSARAAFFAFSRLAAFFRDVTELRLLEPDPIPTRTRDQLHWDYTTGRAGLADLEQPAVWVFELRGATFGTIRGRDLSGHSYSYVVLSDPTLTGTEPVTVRLLPEASSRIAEPVQVQSHPVEPSSTWQLPNPDPTLTLPTYDLEGSLPRVADLPGTGRGVFELVAEHRFMPVIVASRVRLHVLR